MLFLTFACAGSVTVDPVVTTADGETLQGAWLDGEARAAVFKGVPYAEPPVGEGRWRPPAPMNPRTGVRDATVFGSACVQEPGNIDFYRDIAEVFGTDPELVPDLEPMSEDCLYLNLWTTNLGGDEPQPVMVWIHGGSNVAGSGAEPPYDGAALARRGAVVITFNYRLGVFGFLAHPALTAESEHRSSGNYALLDQIALLRWVQRNAAAFGGDPERVTIFGESAGATDVALLMTSPLAGGLFHRAVIQSGGYTISDATTLAEAEADGLRLADELGVSGTDDPATAMRSIDAEDLLGRVSGSSNGRVNSPVIDDWVLTDAPARVFDRGEQAPVPLLVGFNGDEWTTMRRYWPNVTVEALEQGLRASYGELGDEAVELYPAATDAEAVLAADAFQTDLYFACPARFIADRMKRAGAPVYFYRFTRAAPGPGGEALGAFHGAEVPYVFDSLAMETWVPRDQTDQALADTMSDYWFRFAASGDPNGSEAFRWPAYDSESRQHLVLDDPVAAGDGVRDAQCRLFDRFLTARIGLQP